MYSFMRCCPESMHAAGSKAAKVHGCRPGMPVSCRAAQIRSNEQQVSAASVLLIHRQTAHLRIGSLASWRPVAAHT